MDRNLLLHLDGTAHCSVNAIEYDEKEIAASLDNVTSMLLHRGIDYLSAQRTQSLEGSSVIQSDQAAVANHIGIHNGDQLAPIWRLPS